MEKEFILTDEITGKPFGKELLLANVNQTIKMYEQLNFRLQLETGRVNTLVEDKIRNLCRMRELIMDLQDESLKEVKLAYCVDKHHRPF